jgi:hypothetical protein
MNTLSTRCHFISSVSTISLEADIHNLSTDDVKYILKPIARYYGLDFHVEHCWFYDTEWMVEGVIYIQPDRSMHVVTDNMDLVQDIQDTLYEQVVAG